MWGVGLDDPIGRSDAPLAYQQMRPSTKWESVYVGWDGVGRWEFYWNYLHLTVLNYLLYVCVWRGNGRVDTIIILVPKFSDSCQSSEGKGFLEEGEHLISIFWFTSVNWGSWIFFSPTWPLCPNCFQHRTLCPSPQSRSVLFGSINFLKISLSPPTLLGQLLSTWLSGSPLGIVFGS